MNTKISEANQVLREMEAGAVAMLPEPAPEVIRIWAQRLRAALPHLHPQPAELAEKQGEVIVQALADAYSAGAEGLQFGGLARLEALTAATSKQQVGEVQGDARAQFEKWARTQLLVGRSGSISPSGQIAWLAWQAALAARQPGAQVPVFEVIEGPGEHRPRVTKQLSELPPVGSLLYTALPAQADHPYQRIASLQGIGDAADYLARHPSDDYAKRRLSERITEFCQKHGVSPAQGIDLGQFRPAALAYWSECKGQQMNAVGGPFAQQNAAAEKVKEAERLLALIDQRDAAPGVGA